MSTTDPNRPQRGEFSDENLIFLISQPRAGSTLLQSILGGLEQVHTVSEPWLMLHPLYALRERGHTAEYDAVVANRALVDFLATLDNGERDYLAAVRKMALHLYGVACTQAGKLIFLDKTPRYYRILPELRQVFPRARYIILLRNPAAVLSSILHTWVNNNWIGFGYFRDDLLLAPKLLAEFLATSSDQAIHVRYESLLLDPETTTQTICDYLQQPYDPKLLRYGERAPLAGRYGDPSGIGRHNMPSAESLNQWLVRARDPQVNHLLAAYLHDLGPDMIAKMGYDSDVLLAALESVVQEPGRPVVTWSQLLKQDKTFSDKLWLVLQEARHDRRPSHIAKKFIRLLTNQI